MTTDSKLIIHNDFKQICKTLQMYHFLSFSYGNQSLLHVIMTEDFLHLRNSPHTVTFTAPGFGSTYMYMYMNITSKHVVNTN